MAKFKIIEHDQLTNSDQINVIGGGYCGQYICPGYKSDLCSTFGSGGACPGSLGCNSLGSSGGEKHKPAPPCGPLEICAVVDSCLPLILEG